MNDATLKVLEMIADLPEGTEITIPGRGGWQCVLTRQHQEFDFTLECPETDDDGEPTGRYQYFSADTRGSPWGEPRIYQEPTLGVSCHAAGEDGEVPRRIISALVLNSDGQVVKRLSWSELVFVEKRGFEITPTGLLFEQDAAGTKFLVGHLLALYKPDKRRLGGYVGIFGPTKPTQVKVLDLEDLLLRSL